MLLLLRPSAERGHMTHGWLDTFHTFSFAEYDDPIWRSFRNLRVLNEDVIDAGQGFGPHPHSDMEILTYVLEGSLKHGDSIGNGSVIRPGQIQYMSAGTGVVHSEENASADVPVHLLQIWLLPEVRGLPPSYAEANLDADALRGKLLRIAGPQGSGGAVTLHQDTHVYATKLVAGESVTIALQPGRAAWVQVAAGEVTLNGVSLRAGDGAGVLDDPALMLETMKDAHVLVFDLA